MKEGSITLRKTNNVLSIVVVLLALYIVLTPFLPNLDYWWHKIFKQESALVAANDDSRHNKPAEVVPDRNTLVIPAMLAEYQVFDGSGFSTLNKGLWHRPNSSTPDRGGNTVIAGHRFTYTNPKGPFYSLDKVHKGDKIVLYWNKKKYVYRVVNVSEVPPTDAEVEANSDKPMLTLYTCTPLWSAKDRLVVRASLEEGL